MVKIAMIGATGNAGSRILAELARRGHAVTAISRKPATEVPAGVTAAGGRAGLDLPVALRPFHAGRAHRPLPARGRPSPGHAKGESRISFEDDAIALADELESPKHIRQRFTVGC
jgi:putative NADH-flavin reductase